MNQISTISCAEFQEKLPDLFAAGKDGIPEDPSLQNHLDTCDNCSALVRDLQYIADAARDILQDNTPSDNVWSKIVNQMESEQASGLPLPVTPS